VRPRLLCGQARPRFIRGSGRLPGRETEKEQARCAAAPNLRLSEPSPRSGARHAPAHPPRQVIAETEKTIGKTKGIPSRRAADEMIYTLSVLKEALRK
jgi:hypothetical protein